MFLYQGTKKPQQKPVQPKPISASPVPPPPPKSTKKPTAKQTPVAKRPQNSSPAKQPTVMQPPAKSLFSRDKGLATPTTRAPLAQSTQAKPKAASGGPAPAPYIWQTPAPALANLEEIMDLVVAGLEDSTDFTIEPPFRETEFEEFRSSLSQKPKIKSPEKAKKRPAPEDTPSSTEPAKVKLKKHKKHNQSNTMHEFTQ